MDVILNTLLLLTGIDYVLLSVILIWTGYLLKLGFERSVFNLLCFSFFFLLAVFIAPQLAQQGWLVWLLQWHPLTQFNLIGTIIVACIFGLYLGRFLVYKILKASLNIYNPCWFYGVIFWVMTWIVLLLVFEFTQILAIISEVLPIQIQLYDYFYWAIFMVSLTVVVLVLKLIRFDVYHQRDCFLKQGFVWLLQKIHTLANFIHIKKVISLTNHLINLPIALVYSVVVVSVYLALFDQLGLIIPNAEQSFILPYFGMAITEINGYIQIITQ